MRNPSATRGHHCSASSTCAVVRLDTIPGIGPYLAEAVAPNLGSDDLVGASDSAQALRPLGCILQAWCECETDTRHFRPLKLDKHLSSIGLFGWTPGDCRF
jgi:hypothetical protein